MFVFVEDRIMFFFFFSSRRRHTRCGRDWSSDVCSSDLPRSSAREPAADDVGRVSSRGAPGSRRETLVTAPSPARVVAARVLERVVSEGAYADLALDGELDRRGLSARDVAQATALVSGPSRRTPYLALILDHY